jgi:hypothetical protein
MKLAAGFSLVDHTQPKDKESLRKTQKSLSTALEKEIA